MDSVGIKNLCLFWWFSFFQKKNKEKKQGKEGQGNDLRINDAVTVTDFNYIGINDGVTDTIWPY